MAKTALKKWIDETVPIGNYASKDNPNWVKYIDELAYALSESDLLPDFVDTISPEQCFLVWKACEALAQSGHFPSRLRP